MKITPATTRAILKEGIPSFLSTLQQKSTAKKRKRLKDYEIVKCVPGEKILTVQRQHPIILLAQIASQTFLALAFIATTFFFLSYFHILNVSFLNYTLVSYIILAVASSFLLFTTYSFFSWYYRFYIITNKAILHRYSFRIGGEYSETVYADKMHVQDIDRISSNLLYDILRIQDVYVQFQTLEREKPFVFVAPENAQEIDDLIQKLIIESRNGKT